MGLVAGSRIGPYEIQSAIGAGGMGEVYRARDTRLKRDVAIKILPEAFALDDDRLARFEREAQLLASLNHPHIAAIYGIAEEPAEAGPHADGVGPHADGVGPHADGVGPHAYGVTALILELVEGPTLADRLRSGSVPVADAIAIATQIALALEAAHDRGIIHRDLKPANIKLTPDGTVKVLDFGLAKALEPAEAGPHDNPGPNALVDSPTVSAAGTRAGVILGTAAYMSPEQARGQALDARTDIWSFGCVLYELLTGRMAFGGATVTDILAAIVSREPDWSALPPSTPEATRRLLRRSLAKDVRHRLRHIGDARLELEDVTAPAGAVSPRRRSLLTGLAAGLAAGTAAAILLVSVLPDRPVPAPDAIVFNVSASELGDVQSVAAAFPVPSPDGRLIAFVQRDAQGRRAIWIRSLDAAEPRRLNGSDDAIAVFWAHDGRSVGFFAPGRLRKIAVDGGPVQNIGPVSANLGATWNRDGVIVVAPHNRVPLHRVAAAGGTPEPITELNTERRENSHRWPDFLPDGRHFLYTARSDVRDNTGIYVGSLDSRERKWLLSAQSNARYAAPGYLLFVRDGTLLAQRFDVDRLELSGDPVAVAGGVHQITPSASAAFGVSANGMTLSYFSSNRGGSRLTWFDRTGSGSGGFGPELPFNHPRLRPDDRMAAVALPDPDSGNRDVWLIDTSSGAATRLTAHPATDWQAAWSPDGTELVFASDRDGRSGLVRKGADPSSPEEMLLQAPEGSGRFSDDWSPDGRFVIFHQDVRRDTVSTDLWALPLFGDRRPFPLLETRFQEIHGRLSADGRWIAYVSNASGRDEVYVNAFDRPETHRVSSEGAGPPVWGRLTRELFFMGADNAVMAVDWDDRAGFRTGTPKALFRACPDVMLPPGGDVLDVAADGRRFLLACPSANTQSSSVTVMLNWSTGVEHRP